MKYTFPLKQHIGAPSAALVKPGDSVVRGELIAAKPEDGLGANVFSSITGTVSSVDKEKIVVEEKDTEFDSFLSLTGSTPEKLIEESGLVGLGGAGFPTYAKLAVDFKGEGYVLVNAAECEPILSHNIARIEKEPEKLIRALLIVMKITGAGKGVVAIKHIHEEAVRKLKDAISSSGSENDLSIHELEDIYPMGEERAVVRECLDILLEPDRLPLEANAVVVNAETMFRIREAADDKKPFIDKDVTVAGKLSENASVHVLYDQPLGMTVSDLINRVGGIGDEYGEIIMGGPFTGKRTNMDDPFVKTAGGIIAAEKFMNAPEKVGLLVCACGGSEDRLREQAASMGCEITDVQFCKQAQDVKGTLKCENPGHCPGQVEKVLKLKKSGAQGVLISNCTDCTNTVMSCAPQLKLPVFHCTDGALRSVNHKLIRKFKTQE